MYLGGLDPPQKIINIINIINITSVSSIFWFPQGKC